MVLYIRKSFAFKFLSLFLAIQILLNIGYPSIAIAQSSSPQQTESSPSVQANNMVDLFTGDFNYSIPLLEVDGYPLTLNYNGNTTMNQESSWVGLGWSLNPGSISREMRGLPDDFNGDLIKKGFKTMSDETSGKNNGGGATWGGTIDLKYISVYKGGFVELKFGKFNNTYRGKGRHYEVQGSWGIGFGGTIPKTPIKLMAIGGVNGGLSFNTMEGIGMTAGISGRFQYGLSVGVAGTTNFVSAGTTTFNTTRSAKVKYRTKSKGNESYLGLYFSGSSSGQGTNVSYGERSFVPSIKLDGEEIASFSRKANGGWFIVASAYYLNEKYNSTELDINNNLSNPSYGYLNMQNATSSEAIKDFNREVDNIIVKSNPYLPATAVTHDIFRVSTSIDNFTFRAFRNDVGFLGTENNISISLKTNNVKENGYGTLYRKVRGNGFGFGVGLSSIWEPSDQNHQTFKSRSLESSKPDGENYYFKNVGELTPSDDDNLQQYGGENVVYPIVSASVFGSNFSTKIGNQLRMQIGDGNSLTSIQLPANNFKENKKIRRTLYATQTADESSQLGLEKEIKTYALNDHDFNSPSFANLSRVTTIKKEHHLSEITMLKGSGERVIFNTPVYSLKEVEATFNVSGFSADCKNTVQYTPGLTNSLSNPNGKDKLFTRQEIPGYASSFLIGAYLSADYSDLLGDGLSEDDNGTYIKFNHTLVYGESNPFKWRTPHGANKAYFDERNKTYSDDNLGTYIYGEKELWYTHSIEGKNQIANFILEARLDQYSVNNENGGLDINKPSYCLKKIELYNKEDLKNSTQNNPAKPIQTIEFKYNYSLCPNYPNYKNPSNPSESGGKLTLEKIYVYYGGDLRKRLSPYQFFYEGNNRAFSETHVDRWGIYKDFNCTGVFSPNDFPYASQNKTQRDQEVHSWDISRIILPSGSEINIEYESDEYSWVADKKPMQMINVKGFAKVADYLEGSGITTPNIFPQPFVDDRFRVGDSGHLRKVPKKHLYFDLPVPVNSNQELYDKYLKQIFENHNGKIYFKFLVETKDGSNQYEWVEGFVDAEPGTYGVASPNGQAPFNTGYIKLKAERIERKKDNADAWWEVNPIKKQAWQNLRLNVPRTIFPDGGMGLDFDFGVAAKGFNKTLDKRGFCKSFRIESSYIRLDCPADKKLGGGNRVTSIEIKDGWNAQSGEPESVYGQKFIYEPNSGVAQSEPGYGGAENSIRQGNAYEIDNKKHPDNLFFKFGESGESLLPSAIIGYRKVIVEELEYNNVTKNVKGWAEHEFFTAKDFPTKIKRAHSPSIQSLDGDESLSEFGLPVLDLLTISTGFVVEKNDRHGKIKKITTKNNQGNNILSKTYKYKNFDEKVKTVNEKGEIDDGFLARDFDIAVDAFSTMFMKFDLMFTNIEIFSLIYKSNSEINTNLNIDFCSIYTITKNINNYSVLEEVETTYLGSIQKERILAHDLYTGEPIISSSLNEFENEIYNVQYPAQWKYPQMGAACKTINNHISNVNINSSGEINLLSIPTDLNQLFSEGDEISCKNGLSYYKYWVLKVDEPSKKLFLIDENGQKAAAVNNVDIKVIRSGNRNQIESPMQVVSCLDNPMQATNLSLNEYNKIIASSAVTYKNRWKIATLNDFSCTRKEGSGQNCIIENGMSINPYLHGILGNWRLSKVYDFRANLVEQNYNDDINLKEAGTYANFAPYYEYSNGQWHEISSVNHPNFSPENSHNWICQNEITDYSKNGSPIQSKNNTGIYSSMNFGYTAISQKIPIFNAVNARLNQIAFDGFEDYNISNANLNYCLISNHFGFHDSNPIITNNFSHTGRYSLQINNGDEISVDRKVNIINNYCSSSTGISAAGFNLNSCDEQIGFNPTTGKYSISAWVSQSFFNNVQSFTKPSINIFISDNLSQTIGTVNFTATGPIINGWQKIEGVFEIPSNATCISIKLKNKAITNTAPIYFDDIRIQPFVSNLSTFVFDPVHSRLVAEFDDYNYSTRIEYDEQGFPIRVKLETVEGIQTINESRSGLNK